LLEEWLLWHPLAERRIAIANKYLAVTIVRRPDAEFLTSHGVVGTVSKTELLLVVAAAGVSAGMPTLNSAPLLWRNNCRLKGQQ
jgi:hypothetical protein